jgi:chloramphenicol 3-O phosphotransferase
MDKGKVVFLNGPSSSGKTTLAEALQRKLSEPYYILSIDTFYKMLNREKYYGESPNNLEMTIKIMNQTVKLFSDNGYNVILDRVIPNTLRGNKLLNELSDILSENPILYVKVECPLFELERREKLRQDRDIGQAKQQYFSMQENQVYDVKVDTYYMSTEQCIDAIISML